MFSGFKVLRSKSEERKKDIKKSSSKWSLDKALCQGNAGRVKETHQEPKQTENSPVSSLQQQKVDPWPGETASYASSDVTTTRIVGVPIERDPKVGLGINLRPAPNSGSLVVTHIKPYGPTDREGTIKVGDRILAVDGKRLDGLSLHEAQVLLTQQSGRDRMTWLVVEYDVSVMSHLRSTGPLLVEIESSGELMRNEIGLELIHSSNGVIVSKLKTASIAERCGAFLPGDQILAVNEIRVENTNLTTNEVMRILEGSKHDLLKIEILPVASTETSFKSYYRCPSPMSYNLLRQSYHDYNDSVHPVFRDYEQYAKQSSYPVSDFKIESGMVTLQIHPGEIYGIIYRSAPSKKGVVICYIEPSSIADRSGVLQIGDRIITVNGRSVTERNTRLEDFGTTLHLSIQFDVEVWRSRPKEAVKRVKLSRTPSSGFGVTISDSQETGSIIVSEVRWGSVAHRSGRIFIGDRLIGIDETRVTDMVVAMNVFKSCRQEVTFHLLPGEVNTDLGYSSPGLPSVDSAVESWDSSAEPNFYKTVYDSSDVLDWKMEKRESANNSIATSGTQQSDEEDAETCSSLRFSEGGVQGRVYKISQPPPSPPCPLKTNYNLRKINLPMHWRGSSLNESRLEALDNTEAQEKCTEQISFSTFRGPTADREEQLAAQPTQTMFQVTLYKSVVFDDFGFSVSDGLYERGVFVNAVKPGSPADLANSLRPYDKIIKVNDIPTHDLDCCMTVPLMASTGNKLTLTVVRYHGRRPNLPEVF